MSGYDFSKITTTLAIIQIYSNLAGHKRRQVIYSRPAITNVVTFSNSMLKPSNLSFTVLRCHKTLQPHHTMSLRTNHIKIVPIDNEYHISEAYRNVASDVFVSARRILPPQNPHHSLQVFFGLQQARDLNSEGSDKKLCSYRSGQAQSSLRLPAEKYIVRDHLCMPIEAHAKTDFSIF